MTGLAPEPARRRYAPPRLEWRRRMREQVLVQARALAGAGGWDAVRVADLAARAEVSRQWIYTEFGNRAGVAAALVQRETDQFLHGVAAHLDAAGGRVGDALEAGVRHALTEAERNPFTSAVLTAARGGTDALLPFLTARPDPVFTAARALLSAWLAQRLPDRPEWRLTEGADLAVRLTISHMLLPCDEIGLGPQRITRAVLAVLGETPA